jgi:hypothetical protein
VTKKGLSSLWGQNLKLVEWLSVLAYSLVCFFIAPFLIGFPIILAYFRLGRFCACSLGLLYFLVLSWMLKDAAGFAVSILLLSSLSVAFYVERKQPFGVIFFRSLWAVFSGIFATSLGIFWVKKQDPLTYWSLSLNQQFAQMESQVVGKAALSEMLSSEQLHAVKSVFSQYGLGMMGVWIVFYLSLIVFFAVRVLTPEQREKFLVHPAFFSGWALPDFFVWLVIVLGTMTVFGKEAVFLVGCNGLMVLFSLYFLQGVSIFEYFFDFFQIQRFVRTFGYLTGIIFALQQLVALGVAVGFFDQWCDFRSRARHT